MHVVWWSVCCLVSAWFGSDMIMDYDWYNIGIHVVWVVVYDPFTIITYMVSSYYCRVSEFSYFS